MLDVFLFPGWLCTIFDFSILGSNRNNSYGMPYIIVYLTSIWIHWNLKCVYLSRCCVPCDKLLFLLSLFIILNWRWTFTKRRENEWTNQKWEWMKFEAEYAEVIDFSKNQATSIAKKKKMKKLWQSTMHQKMNVGKITGLEFFMLKDVHDENKYVNNIQNSINLPNFHRESKLCISRTHKWIHISGYLSISWEHFCDVVVRCQTVRNTQNNVRTYIFITNTRNWVERERVIRSHKNNNNHNNNKNEIIEIGIYSSHYIYYSRFRRRLFFRCLSPSLILSISTTVAKRARTKWKKSWQTTLERIFLLIHGVHSANIVMCDIVP